MSEPLATRAVKAAIATVGAQASWIANLRDRTGDIAHHDVLAIAAETLKRTCHELRSLVQP